ncbi:hypothetical protein R5R35_007766 [Gryllus longicercus]|uniref:SH3 domain-containing protein n=1 Tax=Gryllus longicercus TaxID=2509291 RepID=A0AAN9Z9E7_9ORTH
MSGTTVTPTLVRAVYSYEGENVDVLSFKKDDIITLTMRKEGGWLEGTLGGKTGWFPSNFIEEYQPQCSGSATTSSTSPSYIDIEMFAPQSKDKDYYIEDIIDAHRRQLEELERIVNCFSNHPLLNPKNSKNNPK